MKKLLLMATALLFACTADLFAQQGGENKKRKAKGRRVKGRRAKGNRTKRNRAKKRSGLF